MQDGSNPGSAGAAARGPAARSRWGLYLAPTREAVTADLQSLRQADGPLRAGTLRHRYALLHLPFLVSVVDPGERVRVLETAVGAALLHPRLTDEQRIIARWVLQPPDEHAHKFLRERRDLASEEVARTIRGHRGEPLLRSVKQIEDRESRIIATVAEVLLDPGFGDEVLAASGLPKMSPPPGGSLTSPRGSSGSTPSTSCAWTRTTPACRRCATRS